MIIIVIFNEVISKSQVKFAGLYKIMVESGEAWSYEFGEME